MDRNTNEGVRQAFNAVAASISTPNFRLTHGQLRQYGADTPDGQIELINGLITLAGALLDEHGGDRQTHLNAAARRVF